MKRQGGCRRPRPISRLQLLSHSKISPELAELPGSHSRKINANYKIVSFDKKKPASISGEICFLGAKM